MSTISSYDVGMTEQQVLQFWFEELKPKQWFMKDDGMDNVIRQRFLPLHERASRCELFGWRATAEGRLAEVLVLDQFSRNLFRNQDRAFAQDSLALALAQEAVRQQADQHLPLPQRTFLYMPYMHSESLAIHEVALILFDQPGMEYNLDFEKRHYMILQRFGRYPHRNQVLGRSSTAEELEFLKQPGSGF